MLAHLHRILLSISHSIFGLPNTLKRLTLVKFHFLILDGKHSFLAQGKHFIVAVSHLLSVISPPQSLIEVVTDIQQ